MANKDLAKWADDFMFTAEESLAAEGPKVFLLAGPQDPLGGIAACAKMYKGEVVRSLADVTDEERQEYLQEIQKTVLKMPLEAVQLHFMVEGVTRSFTHQMVRQRTAAYAQESMRFAVKEDAATAVALPPSLEGTFDEATVLAGINATRRSQGIGGQLASIPDEEFRRLPKQQQHRLKWDRQVRAISDTYLELVNDGMPAEDARGLTVHNITTRLNYITNLRMWYETMAVRVSDQAQFEWRAVAMHMALALREFGKHNTYEVWLKTEDVQLLDVVLDETDHHNLDPAKRFLVRRSSYWQYEALSNELKPIEFKMGKRAFGANFDRPSRIGERVDAFAASGVPSSKWTTGDPKHSIPPIHPEEWLLDPNSARLDSGTEFDVFGNRVPKGEGWHWSEDEGGELKRRRSDGSFEHRRWPEDFPLGATKDA